MDFIARRPLNRRMCGSLAPTFDVYDAISARDLPAFDQTRPERSIFAEPGTFSEAPDRTLLSQ
jgi:hypothetical protein